VGDEEEWPFIVGIGDKDDFTEEVVLE